MAKFEYDKTINKTHRLVCQSCNNTTKHVVLKSVNVSSSEDLDEYYTSYWNTDFEIVQCLGCETISFRKESTNSEDEDYEGHPFKFISLYPERNKKALPLKNYMNVPYNLQRIYKEAIGCYNNDFLTLCGAGVRALVEGLCKENDVTDGSVEITQHDGTTIAKKKTNLQGKINGLHESGKLTKQNAEFLHEHRFLGNEAVHEFSTPSKEDLNLAIEIVENVFDTLYEIPTKGLKLKRKRLNKKTLFNKSVFCFYSNSIFIFKYNHLVDTGLDFPLTIKS